METDKRGHNKGVRLRGFMSQPHKRQSVHAAMTLGTSMYPVLLYTDRIREAIYSMR